MSALGYWVGALAWLACIAIAIALRIHDRTAWQRTAARHAQANTEDYRAQVIQLRDRRRQVPAVPATWGDDAHLR